MTGVGKRTEELFRKLKISSIGSLITFYPVKYENWSNVKKLKDCSNNKDVVEVEVNDNFSCLFAKNGMKIYRVQCVDLNDYGNIHYVTFFNNIAIPEMMKKGERFLIMGDIRPRSDFSY